MNTELLNKTVNAHFIAELALREIYMTKYFKLPSSISFFSPQYCETRSKEHEMRAYGILSVIEIVSEKTTSVLFEGFSISKKLAEFLQYVDKQQKETEKQMSRLNNEYR